MKNIYTDLALETAEQFENEEIEGVSLVLEEIDEIKITSVKIENEKGEKAMQKPIGDYITIESPEFAEHIIETHEKAAEILAKKLSELIEPFGDKSDTLVIGLGNRFVTPDALGPKTISKLLITRHIMEILPKELEGKASKVSGISPGVLGLTGIETLEIVRGITQNTKPSLIIAIDALAARNISRINTTIQLSNTGITPGAGVGSKRAGINQKELGIPVIAIGVPTVVSAPTMVADAMALFFKEIGETVDTSEIIKDTISPALGAMFVSPKEISYIINFHSNIIANAINMALHKGITREDINRFMY